MSHAATFAPETFEKRLESYLARAFGVNKLSVDCATKFTAGGSRETWGFRAEWETGDGTLTERDLVIRMDPEASLLPSNRHVEYAVYKAFAKVPGVPVPEVVLNEDDATGLGLPFFIMSKEKGDTSPFALLSARYSEGRPFIARQMMDILGRIASADWREIGLSDAFATPSPEDVWAVQLEHWDRTLHDCQLGPYPVTEALIRRLRREPPPPAAAISVVHGDYRIGNYLFGPDRIEAIVDWEMAHLGDPLEDIAWVSARNWRSGANPDLVSGLIDRESAISVWEEASGMRVDTDALHWWELFTHLKAMAIWVTGASTRRVKYAGLNWRLADRQEMWMLEDMGVLS